MESLQFIDYPIN